jgi:hypothetical protein
MILMIPALLFTYGKMSAGSQTGQVLTVPTGVILSGAGANGLFRPLILNARKVKSLRHFEKFEDDLLCSKVGEDSYVFVKKTFPAYQRLRFRKFVLNLLIKNGIGKPFEYEQLATPEFGQIVNSLWRQNPEVVPLPKSKLCFDLLLQSSVIVNGAAIQVNFAPGTKMKDQIVQELKASQANLLTNQEDIDNRAKGLKENSKISQYQLMLDAPFPQESNLVRTAMENFQIYFDQETAALDSRVESLLDDPIWLDTKKRRSCKKMQELKDKAPNEYRIMFGIRKDELSQYDKIPSEEEIQQMEQATLSHQFTVSIIGLANGKTFQIQLPI